MKWLDLDRLGIPGVAGLGLIIFCLSFYFGNVVPAEQSLAKLKVEESQLRQTISAQSDLTKAIKSPGTVAPLPPLWEVPELLKKLNSIADKYSVTIGHVSYRLLEKENQRKIEVNLPLQGNYPALRSYLRIALAISPATSLDEMNLQRSSSIEPQVEARVRLSYYLANP